MRNRPIRHPMVPADAVISDVNTTPLIDVMLVLLILCVISIPIMTHKVAIRLPGDDPGLSQQTQVHRLALAADGGLSWNGMPTSLAALPGRLETLKRDPEAMLELSSNGMARYEDFDRLLAVVKRSGIERIGFTGNNAYAGQLDR